MRSFILIAFLFLGGCASEEKKVLTKADPLAMSTATNFEISYPGRERPKPSETAGDPFFVQKCWRDWRPFFTKTEFKCSYTGD